MPLSASFSQRFSCLICFFSGRFSSGSSSAGCILSCLLRSKFIIVWGLTFVVVLAFGSFSC